jgi:hypothetical protein
LATLNSTLLTLSHVVFSCLTMFWCMPESCLTRALQKNYNYLWEWMHQLYYCDINIGDQTDHIYYFLWH